MGGGLCQLVAYGAQDIYLTGNPQITFFKVVYRRHTNFSIESIEQTLSGTTNFNNIVTCYISRNGDLINNMWAQIKLPSASSVITSTGSTYKTWTNNVGNMLIKSSELSIGGQLIDKHYSEWNDIWNELTDPHKHGWKLTGKKNFVAKTDISNNTRYYVPFLFWFCKNAGLSLPLIALQYHDVKLKLQLNTLDNLIHTDGSSVSTSGNISEFKIYVDYIFLDTDERRRFAQVSHEYLIEQVQRTTNNIEDGANSINLNFNHPVKSIYWVINNASREATDTLPVINEGLTDTHGNDWLNYSASSENTDLGYGTYDTFNTAKLLFNGNDRFQERDALYFRQVQPFQHHSNIPKKHIYVYSFAIKPEEHQPSGTCNFSRIDTAKLVFTNVKAGNIKIFAINYNILRIMSGMGGLAYSN
jgi:hypothetical protein